MGGAVLGALATGALFGTFDARSFDSSGFLDAGERAIVEHGVSPSASLDARLAALRAVGEITSIPRLEREIERVASSAQTQDRDLRLEALLMRYLELDPARATRFAARLPSVSHFVAPMFAAWAYADFDAALDGLADVDDAALRRQVALALVGEVVEAEDDIERLAAVAGAGNRSGFVSDALIRLAATDPWAVVERAMSIAGQARREATVRSVAAEWASHDARAALLYAYGISDLRLRRLFHHDVVSAWGAVEPDAALEHLTSAEGRRLLSSLPQTSALSLLNSLAVARPEAALAVADRIPGQMGDMLASYARMRQVELDLPAALAEIETTADDLRRVLLVSAVALTYARRDPDAALAWARSLDPASQARILSTVVSAGINTLAERDLAAALDMALANPTAAAGIANLLRNHLSSLAANDFRQVTDRLVAAGPAQQAAVQTLLQAWPARDADGAWNWLVGQGSADAALVRAVAAGYGANGVTLPAQRAYELPDGVRGAWVTAYASAFARSDPDAAVEWLQSFAGEPSYEAWAAEIVDALVNPASQASPAARLHPRPAARIIATMQAPGVQAAVRTALFWTREQPREALRWAQDLADPEARSAAIAQTVGAWTIDDPAAARQSVLGLPRGELRDRALAAQLAQEIASHGSFDRSILAAFSSQSASEAAVRGGMFDRAFRYLGSRDAETAKRLLDELVQDEAVRRDIARDIDGAADAGGRLRPTSKFATVGVLP